MDDVTTSLGNLVVNTLFLLVGPTVLMLLIRRFVPYLGERLWRVYCDVLIWLLKAPFRLVRLLIKEVTTRNRL